MLKRKTAIKVELGEYFLFIIVHMAYAVLFESQAAERVFIYALVMSVLGAASLLMIKNPFWSQIVFIICTVIATHLIGTAVETLAFGVCIYMVSGALLSIIGDHKINIIYICLVNVAIVVGVLTEYDVITKYMPIHCYILLVMLCEGFLITENAMVLFYLQKMQEVKTQNAILNSSQQSKDEFLASMSHEIRTPMNAIVGMSELIMRDEETSDRIKEYCYNIQTSGENLLGIINDILDFSKIESGKMEINYEPYSIASVVQDVANTAMFRRGFKNIDIIIDCHPNMPKLLMGDVLRNRQILMNIVNNAVKFTDEGYVYIALYCYNKDGKNWLKMKVEDTGIGIKKKDQLQLFESFSRIDSARNRSVEGTGLGLAICKRLAQAMDGTIQMFSEYGKGTVLEVDIPQEIKDSQPFLMLNDKEDMRIILYGDKKKYSNKGDEHYQTLIQHMWDSFQVPCHIIVDMKELMKSVSDGEVTHLFVGAGEYTDDRNYFDRIAQDIAVFVMFDPQYPLRLGKNIHGVHMPFYSINLVSALNGDTFYNQLIDEKEVKITFKAPFARVLVVDDNEINLRVAQGILELYDTRCILARSGKEAIELLRDQDIDIVFMDHMMPELDGVETVEIIRRTGGEYGKNLPIIALTANVVNDAKDMFLQNGFQDFLPKPVGLKAVDAMLKKWLPKEKMEPIPEGHGEPISTVNTESEKEIRKSVNSDVLNFVPMHIDDEKALENMGGMRDLYKELLECSVEMEEQRMAEINENFEQRNWKEYQITVHALKGAMRSLGIEEMALVAQGQEFACKEKRYEDAIEGHAHFVEESDRAHRTIEEYLKNYKC